MMMAFINFLQNIYFLIHVSSIITYEFCKYYCWINDFENCILNLSTKLSKKNILYVKIFQACALNNNIIDDSVNNKLIKFTDNAPWSQEDDVDLAALLEVEKEYDIIIENNLMPINSGMISLVYKGRDLLTDDTVILKIKRKNIEIKLNDGIKKLLFFLKIVDLIPFVNNYGLPEVIHKNIGLINHQTDFLAEVKNIQRFKQVCGNLKYIVIPEVYERVTTRFPNIILMEYIQGKTIYQVDKKDYETFAKRVLQFFFITMLVHGVMHGDLHIGNVLFINDEAEKDEKYRCKLGILDFGIIYEIKETKDALFSIFTELCSAPPRESACKVLRSGLLDPVDIIKGLPAEHFNRLADILEGFINAIVNVDKKIYQSNVYKFLLNLNDYISHNKIDGLTLKFSDNLLKIQLMFGMLHGVLLTLYNNKEYMDFSHRVIRETFQLDLLEDDDIENN